MKPGVVLVNTGRGSLIDSRALIGALKSGHLGPAGLDVYEEEEGVFFEDLSNRVLQDDVIVSVFDMRGRCPLDSAVVTSLRRRVGLEEGPPPLGEEGRLNAPGVFLTRISGPRRSQATAQCRQRR
jgi:hypothetical protein